MFVENLPKVRYLCSEFDLLATEVKLGLVLFLGQTMRIQLLNARIEALVIADLVFVFVILILMELDVKEQFVLTNVVSKESVIPNLS